MKRLDPEIEVYLRERVFRLKAQQGDPNIYMAYKTEIEVSDLEQLLGEIEALRDIILFL